MFRQRRKKPSSFPRATPCPGGQRGGCGALSRFRLRKLRCCSLSGWDWAYIGHDEGETWMGVVVYKTKVKKKSKEPGTRGYLCVWAGSESHSGTKKKETFEK